MRPSVMAEQVIDYRVGDRVDVYDGDIPGWVPGVVESIEPGSPLGEIIMVKTERVYQRLPMLYGVPVTRLNMLRPRLVNE